MSRTIPDDEIESRLAPGVGKDPSSRARLLAVLEILRVFSDEQDGLTAGEIARIIGRRSGKAPSENTVLEDLKALAENPPFGIEIKAASKGDKKGFRCVQRLVTPDEAAVLVNLVKTCKYLSPAQRNSLSGKLIEAMPPEKQDDVVETVYVDERQTSSFTDVFQTANTASRAIREGHMVSFRTCSHLMNGTVSKGGVLTEAPVALIYSFGHYYLKTWDPSVGDESERVNLRRLDRMVDVSLGGKVKDKGRISQLSREVVRETSEKFDMYGDGTCRTLFLRVEGSHAKYVYDAFGHDIRFEHIDEEAAVGYVCVRAQLSPTFFRWLFGMSPKITLHRPEGLTWVRRFGGLNECSEPLLNILKKDYLEAEKQFIEQLEITRITISNDARMGNVL